MKILAIRNSKPVKYLRTLYYANKPLEMYKPQPQRPAFLKKENKLVRFFKNMF